MSVQAGIWNLDGAPVDHKLLADFSGSLKQLGPDGESSYVKGNIAMLYRPFHTTAESRREKQPYCSRRSFVLTWDGRLDNRDELIADLRGEVELESTDVAIVAAAFDRWETNCFRRIIGDWAVSIWKAEQRELIFAIDYMAVRHIFYYLHGDRVWWSTDLTPLVLLSGDKFHIDDDYIAGYFAHDPDAHLTPYREIREVPPSQFVRVCNGRVYLGSYWRFNPKSRKHYKTDADYEEHFRYVFRQSVRRRLRSDSPILAELSGGLDSSSIVCMADDILAKEGAQTPRLDTLSYYDNTEKNGDDWVYFQKIEETRRRVGVHIDASELGDSAASLDYPDFLAMPGHLGSAHKLETKRANAVKAGGYRAVLSGVGGDEFMGGIPDPRGLLADLIVQLKIPTLARQLIAWSLVKRHPWIQLLWQSFLMLWPSSRGRDIATHFGATPWVDAHFRERAMFAHRLLGSTEDVGFCLPSRRSYINGLTSMADKLAKAEPPTLALEEPRYPYLDRTLIEFVVAIPATQLLRPGERRSLMRRALAGIVPRDILSRRTKQFAARTPVIAVVNKWDELQQLFDRPLSSTLGYINPDRLIDSLKAARNGREIHILRMLRTISLEFWLRDLAARRLITVETVPRLPPSVSSLHVNTQPQRL